MTPFLRGLATLATLCALCCGLQRYAVECAWLMWAANSLLWASICWEEWCA